MLCTFVSPDERFKGISVTAALTWSSVGLRPSIGGLVRREWSPMAGTTREDWRILDERANTILRRSPDGSSAISSIAWQHDDSCPAKEVPARKKAKDACGGAATSTYKCHCNRGIIRLQQLEYMEQVFSNQGKEPERSQKCAESEIEVCVENVATAGDSAESHIHDDARDRMTGWKCMYKPDAARGMSFLAKFVGVCIGRRTDRNTPRPDVKDGGEGKRALMARLLVTTESQEDASVQRGVFGEHGVFSNTVRRLTELISDLHSFLCKIMGADGSSTRDGGRRRPAQSTAEHAETPSSDLSKLGLNKNEIRGSFRISETQDLERDSRSEHRSTIHKRRVQMSELSEMYVGGILRIHGGNSQAECLVNQMDNRIRRNVGRELDGRLYTLVSKRKEEHKREVQHSKYLRLRRKDDLVATQFAVDFCATGGTVRPWLPTSRSSGCAPCDRACARATRGLWNPTSLSSACARSMEYVRTTRCLWVRAARAAFGSRRAGPAAERMRAL